MINIGLMTTGMNFRYKIFVLLFILSGCAISFTGGGFKGSLKIEPLKNETVAYGIETRLTSSLITAFNEDGRIKVSEKGDYILKGKIVEYKKSPASYTESGVIKEYRYEVGLHILVEDKEGEKKLMDRTIKESIIQSSDKDDDVALNELSDKIKDTVVRAFLDSW